VNMEQPIEQPKPAVRSSKLVDDWERRYEIAHRAEIKLRDDITALRRELTIVSRERARLYREYRAAKSSTDEAHGLADKNLSKP